MNPMEHFSKVLNKETAKQILTDMYRIRRMEEACAQLYSAGKIRGFLHLYIGEEAIAASLIPQLKIEDQMFCTYREHAHALLKGVSMDKIMAEMYGKIDGCSKGRGGSMHLFDTSKGLYGGNAIVAGHLPLAVGMAMANKMQNNGAISVCFFGEGAIAEGEFHESMNLAALWKLPVLFVCENNYYAMGTALERSESQVNLTKKAQSYNVTAKRVNGMSASHMYEAANEAIEFVREKQQPYFLECDTYRFRAHSMFDPELYREKEEVERWKQNDPIKQLTHLMLEKAWITESEISTIDEKAMQEIQMAKDYAENSRVETMEETIQDIIVEVQS
jgi:pyruvate dehydrogenase E1 component alpha subunit